MAFDDIEKASLPALAEMMHGDVIRVNQKQHIRSIATFISSQPYKSTIRFGEQIQHGHGHGIFFFLSSCLHCTTVLSLGPLGKPTLIRRLDFVPFEKFHILHAAKDGESGCRCASMLQLKQTCEV